MSTPARRAAARDRWNNPRVIRLARALEWTAALAATAAVFTIGSLNF